MFILLEDEFGTVNLVVPPAVYERHRLLVRTEPLLRNRTLDFIADTVTYLGNTPAG